VKVNGDPIDDDLKWAHKAPRVHQLSGFDIHEAKFYVGRVCGHDPIGYLPQTHNIYIGSRPEIFGNIPTYWFVVFDQ
jgi:hypothetical protein